MVNIIFFLVIAAVLFILLTKETEKIDDVEDEFSKLRKEMVEIQLKGRDITDAKVLEVMSKVPRHLFIPANTRIHAYNDNPLPIGGGQTISQPYIVALMTQELDLKPTDKVLEIGTGSGYQAAVLGEIVSEVYTIEIVEELTNTASETLDKLGYDNVHVRYGDGYYGWPEEAPFDAIIVTAAAKELPEPLFEQLKVGGKLIMPQGKMAHDQVLTIMEKVDEESAKNKRGIPVIFVPLTGEGAN